MPPAARKTDIHSCPAHGRNPVVAQCAKAVIIGFQRAARVTDVSDCNGAITEGSPTVIIEFQEAARIGDPTSHGGVIVTGEETVLIGNG